MVKNASTKKITCERFHQEGNWVDCAGETVPSAKDTPEANKTEEGKKNGGGGGWTGD